MVPRRPGGGLLLFLWCFVFLVVVVVFVVGVLFLCLFLVVLPPGHVLAIDGEDLVAGHQLVDARPAARHKPARVSLVNGGFGAI